LVNITPISLGFRVDIYIYVCVILDMGYKATYLVHQLTALQIWARDGGRVLLRQAGWFHDWMRGYPQGFVKLQLDTSHGRVDD
jgi:hypothetical protein